MKNCLITGGTSGLGIELAKVFGATDGHKYVNSILDKVALNHRAIEIEAKQKSSVR